MQGAIVLGHLHAPDIRLHVGVALSVEITTIRKNIGVEVEQDLQVIAHQLQSTAKSPKRQVITVQRNTEAEVVQGLPVIHHPQ